jgi:putative endonuclease|tara:strand:- start:904 stop:1194 length:291 start_codon:yes stop_codon:yes gene_type:complete
MTYCVYLLISSHKSRVLSYVGYTKNLKNRLNLHNISRGAKCTRGKKWIVFHKEIYNSKSKAMSREHRLKKDRKFRNFLKEKFKKVNKRNIYYKNGF